MILIDFSAFAIASYMAAIGDKHTTKLELDWFRHAVINSIRKNYVKHHARFGEMIICMDCSVSWRKKFFPYYKANRVESRKESTVDWDKVYRFIDQVGEEMKEHFPYKVILVDGAEADDIIGVLSRKAVQEGRRCLIISRDKDFIQLQAGNDLVKQYDPRTESFITHDDPSLFLFEHIIKGDAGDGVPSVFCEDDHFIVKKARAKPVTKILLSKLYEEFKSGKHPEMIDKERLNRNYRLVFLGMTPKDIQEEILKEYDIPVTNTRRDILPYFVKHGLKKLSTQIGDF